MSETGVVLESDGSVDPDANGGHVTIEPEQLSRARMLEANNAARAAGMVSLRASRLKGAAGIGDYISELGAVKIGRAHIVGMLHQMQQGLEQINRDTEATHDMETKVALYKSRNEMFAGSIRAAEVLIKSAEMEKAAPPGGEALPAWGPPAPTPISVTVNQVNSVVQNPPPPTDPEPPAIEA